MAPAQGGATPSDPDALANVTACLRAAVAVSERLAEAFGDVAEQAADEAVLAEALRFQEAAVGHLALLAERLETISSRRIHPDPLDGGQG